MIIKKSLLLSLLTLIPLHAFEIIDHGNCIDIHTEYGSTAVDEQVIIDLLRCEGFQRLRHVRQYGTTYYTDKNTDYTRFEHSVGVFVLLRLFNTSLEEQIAGLLHDASHTVYSHVADHLFTYDKNKGAYQDSIHEWALEQLGITAILKRYNLKHACSAQLKESLRALKQPYPDLCADRIEYNLKGGLFEGILSTEDITRIIADLHFDGINWYFTSVETARKLADVSLILCDTIWGSGWNTFVYKCTAQALKHALLINLITIDEIHFSTDDVIWHKLKNSTDPVIQPLIDKIEHWQQYMTQGNAEHFNLHSHGKFSGVNPLIKTETGFVRLTAVDAEFKTRYHFIKEKIAEGEYILFTHDNEQLLHQLAPA